MDPGGHRISLHVIPGEHLCLPSAEDVSEGGGIAAYSADIAKGIDEAMGSGIAMSRAQKAFDWTIQYGSRPTVFPEKTGFNHRNG